MPKDMQTRARSTGLHSRPYPPTHLLTHPARPLEAPDSTHGTLPVRPADRSLARLSPPRQRARAR
ncbi:hypothetical protein K523DRAFT_325410, partial [Schizophyllum commune Tattone D]